METGRFYEDRAENPFYGDEPVQPRPYGSGPRVEGDDINVLKFPAPTNPFIRVSARSNSSNCSFCRTAWLKYPASNPATTVATFKA